MLSGAFIKSITEMLLFYSLMNEGQLYNYISINISFASGFSPMHP